MVFLSHKSRWVVGGRQAPGPAPPPNQRYIPLVTPRSVDTTHDWHSPRAQAAQAATRPEPESDHEVLENAGDSVDDNARPASVAGSQAESDMTFFPSAFNMVVVPNTFADHRDWCRTPSGTALGIVRRPAMYPSSLRPRRRCQGRGRIKAQPDLILISTRAH